jgi:DNA-binding SARP family transcriptional activator/WD40 repeat protein
MRIAVLGPLEVRRDTGDPVAVPGAKERLLLAVLTADMPDVVSTERIVETLWNGDRPPSARNSLLVHLVHLRSTLEPERPRGSTGRYILRRGAGYSLAADRDDVDALMFTDGASRGRALLAAGDTAEAVRTLSAALDLWRGEPYGDWPDADFAVTERRRLGEVRTGAVTALLEARLSLGEDADVVPELERLLAGDPLQEEWWRLLVLALYRSGRQGQALAAAQRARRVLAEELGTDPGPRLRAVEAAVLAQDTSLDRPLARVPHAGPLARDVATCPYKGLATYQPADAALFHGRTRLVSHLVARLVDAPLLVVSGPSGAGKSSVVRAGLLPALARDALPGSAGWRAVVLTPGRRPVDTLTELTGEAPPGGPVLLVCDQFEELWAPGVDPAERTAFLDTVLGLLADGIVARCVVVVRGDHVGLLAEHTALAERVGSGVVLVPSLTGDELHEVVVAPAAAVGLDVEPELVTAVVADVRDQPGALPLLSMALVGTWERRRGERLTLAGYLEAGGVAGALTGSAEAAYATLAEPGQAAARRLLVRLADTDEAGALVRRPARLTELDLHGDGGDIRRAVIESFVARRLLTLDGDRLVVAHEALLTAWPRLARWLEDDAAGRAVRRHLTPVAREWQQRGEAEAELYRGPRLAAALDWAAADGTELTDVERRFLDASKARADAELLAAREQTRREAAGRRRTRRLAAGLAAVVVIAVVAAGLVVRSQRASDRASVIADANRLAALSTAVSSMELSSLLAAHGFRLADTPETQDALLAGLVEHRRAVRAVTFSGNLFAANLGNDGRTLYIAAGLQVLRWDVGSGEPPRPLIDTPELERWAEGWAGAAASPTDDRTAYIGTAGGRLWLRMVDGRGRVRSVPSAGSVLGEPFGVAFAPEGDLVDVLVARPAEGSAAPSWRLVRIDPSGGPPRDTDVAGSLPGRDGGLGADFAKDGSTAVIWAGDDPAQATLVDLGTGRQAVIAPPAREGNVSDFRALSSGAAVLWDDGVVTLVDRAGRVEQELRAHQEPVRDVALAPDGSWAASVGGSGEVVLWDVDPATGLWSQRESLEGHDADVVVAEIDPAGAQLVTGSTDNQLIVWAVRSDGGFGTAQPGMAGRWPAGAPAVVEPGRLVVVPTRTMPPVAREVPYDGLDTLDVAATFVDPSTGEVVEQIRVGDTVADAWHGASAAVSADGRWVAITSGLAATVLDARTREIVRRIELPRDDETRVDEHPYPSGMVCCAAWTRDGSRLLLGAGGHLPGPLVPTGPEQDSGEIAVVDTGSWDVVDHLPLERAPTVLALDDDGRRLAVGSSNHDEILVLDPGTLAEIERVRLRDGDSMWALAFSPDGRLLAGAGELGRVHAIDTGTWRAREPVAVRAIGPTNQLTWLRDNRTVVSAGMDGTAVLFDVERAVVRAAPLPASTEGGGGYTGLLPGAPGELSLVVEDRAGLRYPVAPSGWLRAACDVAGRDLTSAEWDRYLPGRPYAPTCSDLA